MFVSGWHFLSVSLYYHPSSQVTRRFLQLNKLSVLRKQGQRPLMFKQCCTQPFGFSMSNQAEACGVRVREARKPCQAEGARGVGMEQQPAPIPCSSLVVFLCQPACRASQTIQARLSIPSLAEKFNPCIFFEPFLLTRRYHSGRWLLFLPSLRTEIVAAVRGGPSLLLSPPSEEPGCRAERLRHPGRRDPWGLAGHVASLLAATQPAASCVCAQL